MALENEGEAKPEGAEGPPEEGPATGSAAAPGEGPADDAEAPPDEDPTDDAEAPPADDPADGAEVPPDEELADADEAPPGGGLASVGGKGASKKKAGGFKIPKGLLPLVITSGVSLAIIGGTIVTLNATFDMESLKEMPVAVIDIPPPPPKPTAQSVAENALRGGGSAWDLVARTREEDRAGASLRKGLGAARRLALKPGVGAPMINAR